MLSQRHISTRSTHNICPILPLKLPAPARLANYPSFPFPANFLRHWVPSPPVRSHLQSSTTYLNAICWHDGVVIITLLRIGDDREPVPVSGGLQRPSQRFWSTPINLLHPIYQKGEKKNTLNGIRKDVKNTAEAVDSGHGVE